MGLKLHITVDHCGFSSAEIKKRIKEAMVFKEDLGNTLPGLENLVIYSDSEETFDHIVLLEHAGWHFGQFKDSGQKGDLLVPVDSATLNNPTSARKVWVRIMVFRIARKPAS